MIDLRSIAVTAVAMMLVVACSKSEPPPPPKAEAPQPVAPPINEDVKRLASEVYVFAYPLVLMDVTKQIATAKAPVNTFQHKRSFPDASMTDVAGPNADTLSSQAWLDLSKEPIILSLPDTRGRYYVMQMLDAWTNVFSSLGKRSTGTEKGDFAIIGPKWKGEIPKDVQEVKSPTDMVWLIGRTQTNGKSDYAAVAKLQDQYRLTPLSQWGKRGAKAPEAAAPPAGVDVKTPPSTQVVKMDPQRFFSRFASLLPGNPPAGADAPTVEKMKRLGITPGEPFDLAKLGPASVKSVEEGTKSAQEAIAAAVRGTAGAELKNGWTTHLDLGRYGTAYGKRAVVAWIGLGAGAPEDEIRASARFDGGGKSLSGANKYVLHFDNGKTPPANGIWSLTLYDDKQAFVANPLERFSVGDRDKLKANPDGSLDLYIQNENPGADKESNWLPAPKGGFNLIMRIYSPKQDVLDGRWAPPAIRRVT